VLTFPAYVIADAIGRLLPVVALAGVAIEATLLFRLWHQMAGSVPGGWPWAWVYGFGGSLIGPFRHYDTVQPQAPVVDLAGLVALEVYLVTTLALVGITLICRIASRPDVTVAITTLMVWRTAKRGASGLLSVCRYLSRQSWRLAAAIDSYIQSRDWPRYRRAGESVWRSATSLTRRAQLAAGTWRTGERLP
jgi:hypothetical protein